MSEWISVKDRLPDEGQNVLIYYVCSHTFKESPYATSLYEDKEFKVDHFCENSDFDTVTHWMPLPEPPKDINNE